MYIGFSASNTILGSIIRWVTRSKASHTFIRFKTAGEDVIIHSNAHGVNLDYYPKFKKRGKIISEYKLTMSADGERAAVGYAIKKLDRPYDILAIFGFLWVIIAKSFGKKVKNPFPNRSAYFCSELVIRALVEANFPGAGELDPELTSPEDIIEFLESHKDVESKQ